MQFRTLGKTGYRVSEIGFGAWGIGGSMWQGSDDDTSLAALSAALDVRLDFIDTALAYGDGHSEKLVARALRGRPGRVVVATKIPPKNYQWPARRGVPLRKVFPASYVRRCAERSVRNLERPIDLLQFHVWVDEWLLDADWPEVERTMQALIVDGTVRAWGISINDHEPGSALQAVSRCDLIASVQVIYNVFDRSPERQLFPLCRERNVGVIARVPLDEGGLTGKIGPDTRFPRGDWRDEYFRGKRRAEVQARVRRLEPVLLKEATSLVEGALRFCLSDPAVSTVIPGMRTPEHARANCAVSDGRVLSGELLAALKEHQWERNFYE